jgi:hypothetical protein
MPNLPIQLPCAITASHSVRLAVLLRGVASIICCWSGAVNFRNGSLRIQPNFPDVRNSPLTGIIDI